MRESNTVSDLAEEVTTYVAQLQAENAKLRELLADVWNVYCTCNGRGRELYIHVLGERMRELGVEVEQ